MQRILMAVMALCLAMPAGFAKDKAKKKAEDPDPGKGVNFYSLEKEIALGKQMAEEVEREARLITDPAVSEYVNRLGQNLVRNSDAKVPFTIKVVDSEEINAFALPGGFLFVNAGLVLRAENEAQLAGVMAHEISHVAARHATQRMSKAAQAMSRACAGRNALTRMSAAEANIASE